MLVFHLLVTTDERCFDFTFPYNSVAIVHIFREERNLNNPFSNIRFIPNMGQFKAIVLQQQTPACLALTQRQTLVFVRTQIAK